MKVPITVFVEVELLNKLDTRIKSDSGIKNRSDYINSLIEADERSNSAKIKLDVEETNKQTTSTNKKKGSK